MRVPKTLHHPVLILLAAMGVGKSDPLPAEIEIKQIEVNVRAEGVFQKDDRTIMNSGDELRGYFKKEKALIDGKGLKPALAIRAENGVRFRAIQKVIQAGASVGLKEVVYMTSGLGNKNGQDRKKTVESSALPVVEPSDQPSELAPLTILIEANGNVSLKDEAGTVELLETDSSKRDLPNVAARLKIYQMAADLTAAKPTIQLQVDPDALHRRVIDVLNVVTGAKISEITFIGLPKPDEKD